MSDPSTSASTPEAQAQNAAAPAAPRIDVTDLRRQAEAALAAGDLPGAEALTREALAAAPADIFALVVHARVAQARGDETEAFARLDVAQARHPGNSWPLLERGSYLQGLGRADEAIAAWTAGLALNPQEFHCHVALARTHRARGETEAAREHFAAAVAIKPDSTVVWGEYARLERARGGQEAGLAILAGAVAACGETAAIARLRIELLMAAGKWSEAAPAIEAALGAAPQDAGLRLDLARTRAALGEAAAAEALFAEVARDDAAPKAQRVDAGLAGGRLCRARGDNLAALAFYQRAALTDPAQAMPLCEAARVWIECRVPDVATGLFEKAVALDEKSISAWIGLSDVLCSGGRHEEALRAIGRAAAINPGNSYVVYRTGVIEKDIGNRDAAAATLSRLEPQEAHYDLAQAALGHMARDEQRHEAALRHFEAAARAAANPEGAWGDLVAICLDTGDLDGARRWIEAIMARDPASYRGQMALGRLLRARRDRQGALAAFEAARDIAPDLAQPLVEIAGECDALGDASGAGQAIDRALALNPHSHEGLLKKAELLARAGGIEAALAVYARLRQAEPTAIWAYLGAASLLGRHGAPEAGLALLDEAARLCPAKAAIDARRADIQRQRGLIPEAVAILDGARARFPHDPWLWLNAALLATQYGDKEKADLLLAEAAAADGPQKGRVCAVRARRHEMTWDLAPALDCYRAAAAADPGELQHWMDIARLALLGGDIAAMKEALQAHAALRRTAAGSGGASINISQSLLGQIHDEVRLEPEVVARLRLLGAGERQEAVRSLGETVRAFPDSTVAAIGLAVALRRAGALARPSGTAGEGAFPALISQYWNEPEPPEDVAVLMASWAVQNPDHRILRFDEESAAAYLRDVHGAAAQRAFARAPHQAQKADLLRLGVLAHQGGVYADADDRCRAPIATLAPQGASLFLYQEDHGSLGNNVIAAQPGHPAIVAAFAQAVAAVLRADLDIIWLATGPGLLTRAVCGWLAETPDGMEERLATTAIVTVQEMRRLAAMHCHAVYKTTGNAWLNATFRKA